MPAAHPGLEACSTLPQHCRRLRVSSTSPLPTPSHLSDLSFSHSFIFFFFIQCRLHLGVPCSTASLSCTDPQTSDLNTGNVVGVSAHMNADGPKKKSQTNTSVPPLLIKHLSWPCSPQNRVTSYSSWLSFVGRLSPSPWGARQADKMGTESQIHHQRHLTEASTATVRLPWLFWQGNAEKN